MTATTTKIATAITVTTAQHAQQDAHLANWLRAKFNLTVEYQGRDLSGPCFGCWEGDYDLDTPSATDATVFGAALEHTACYDGATFDKLVAIELGEAPAIEQLCELVEA